jgi:uncharacterized protein (DUF305 family)
MDRKRMLSLVAAVVVLLGTGVSVLIARSGGERSAAAPVASPSTPPVRVLVPGRPGESARVTDSVNVRGPDGTTYNSIDTAFVQMMIAHHQQAVRMAELADTRAANTQLRNLAGRIAAVQNGEIGVFRGWLRDRRLPESDPAHDHSTMPGMQTEAAIAELTAATGAEFDRRFVEMMTAHHRGAQQMAADVLRGGSDQRLAEQANEMAVEQVSEIRRMAQLGIER